MFIRTLPLYVLNNIYNESKFLLQNYSLENLENFLHNNYIYIIDETILCVCPESQEGLETVFKAIEDLSFSLELEILL